MLLIVVDTDIFILLPYSWGVVGGGGMCIWSMCSCFNETTVDFSRSPTDASEARGSQEAEQKSQAEQMKVGRFSVPVTARFPSRWGHVGERTYSMNQSAAVNVPAATSHTVVMPSPKVRYDLFFEYRQKKVFKTLQTN